MAAAATDSNSGEEILRQRVRENLKHLQELGLSNITRELLDFAQREYKLLVNDAKLRPYRKRSSTNQNAGRSYAGRTASENQKVEAFEKAEKLQRNLKARHPSFLKCMLRSHVSGGFWLGLPTSFCKDNLPLADLRMILEDEKGVEYDVLYLGRKMGLSGGWRGFSMAHDLEDGDALVFELTAPARFKVHIIKAVEEERSGADGKEEKREESDGGKENRPPKTAPANRAPGGAKRKLK